MKSVTKIRYKDPEALSNLYVYENEGKVRFYEVIKQGKM